MDNRLADRVFYFAESQTLEMAKRARELSSNGTRVINLSLGEPDFATPTHIADAAKKAIDNGITKYSPVAGFLELRQAISEKFSRENSLKYSPEQIVVSSGAKHSIMNVILSIINPGDEVILPTPYWVSYPEMVKLASGVPVFVKASVNNNYKVSAQEIEKAITPKTKMFLFSSPCNPSGSVYSKQELKDIADVFAKHPNIYIVSDEIYEHINFVSKHESIGQFESVSDRVITVNGVAKAFAMTGWRIGYIGAPEFIAKACEKIQGQFTSGANSIAQMATIEAITSPLDATKSMVSEFLNRRNLVLQKIKEIPGIITNTPQGAFYIFPDFSHFIGKTLHGVKINSTRELCYYILDKANVSVVSGEAFGNPECVRISYSVNQNDLNYAFEKIKEVLS
ncbi:MAG: pyridoxal phosphate-dependent aminotransferase [Bacteroidia bacterium]|nr:pyridoxal phosphate-dependent aminotransferase [Bacteroidia bacterium]